jgi:hypothetical protein
LKKKSTPKCKSIGIEEAFASYVEREERPYKCQVPGCEKSYKNANGLKYHRRVCFYSYIHHSDLQLFLLARALSQSNCQLSNGTQG